MRKKRLIAFGALLAALMAIGLYVLWPRDPGPQVQVIGDFLPEDVAAIKRAVRHQIWKEAVPHLSWTSIKGLGGVLKRNATEHLVSIQEAHITVRQNSFSSVIGSAVSSGQFKGDAIAVLKSGKSERTLIMSKGSNDWYCATAFNARIYITIPVTNR